MQRYTIDLSYLFSDYRQKVFVGRRPQWKQIDCLLDHIRCIFQLKRPICLTNQEDVLFPEKEDLDLILESDQLIVHAANSLDGSQEERAPKESRVAAVNQNGKRKRDLIIESKPSKKVEEACSDSESDDDDNDSVLPKIFVAIESASQQDESIEDIPKLKRKRIRKRKSKKVEESVPSKVVVKTYGKSKIPAIITENGSSNHVRFEHTDGDINDDEEGILTLDKNEPYRNLNKTTVPRVIKAVLQSPAPLDLNDDVPSIPDYDSALELEMKDIANKTNTSKKQPRPPKISLEIKQELIETNSNRVASPTWDTEMDQAKEAFLSAYRGEEFWSTLQESLENFPNIDIPSVNDIIAYRINTQSYLALVERADDGENDERPALKLTIRKLNETSTTQPGLVSVTLDQLTDIRLVATYQP